MLRRLLGVCLLLGSRAFAADLALGVPAPEVQARLLDGEHTFLLSAQRGKVIVLNFWASWCAPCKAEMPLLQSYYDQHKAQGLELLAISMDDATTLPEARTIAKRYSFPIAWKSESSFKGLGRIWRLPTTFVIDREGMLRRNGQVGDAEITQAELDALLAPLLAK